MGDDGSMREKSRVRILLAWIHDMLLIEGVCVLTAAVQHLSGRDAEIFLLKGLFMFIPVVLSYILVRRCRNILVFLVFAMAAVWGMLAVSRSFLMAGLTAFVFLFRCYTKLKQGEIRRKMRELPGMAGAQAEKETWEIPTLLDTPRVWHSLILVLLYLVVVYFQEYALLVLMLGILVAEFCICMAYCYLERLEGFIKDNVSVANLPVGVMKKIGTGILLSGITALLLFMVPAAVYHEEPLTKLRLEMKDVEIGSVEHYEEDSGPDYMMEELAALKSQAKEVPEWVGKIFQIVSFLIMFGVTCLVLRVIVLAVKKAMESFSDSGDDEIIFLGEENDSGSRHRILKRKERESLRSPDRKIRRYYKKLIKHHLKEDTCGNETPFELENKAGLYEKEEINAAKIHELYEKARYGKEECTDEDVRRFQGV